MSFSDDMKWQKSVRDRLLAPFYGAYSHDGRYVFIDKGRCAGLIQKRLAVDTVLQSDSGEALCIEEKITRWKGKTYANFFLETDSCTIPGRETPGWMRYAEADYLLYCFETANGGLDCHLIDFSALRAWFWPKASQFKNFTCVWTNNKTSGRLVPIADVVSAVPSWRFILPQKTEIVA